MLIFSKSFLSVLNCDCCQPDSMMHCSCSGSMSLLVCFHLSSHRPIPLRLTFFSIPLFLVPFLERIIFLILNFLHPVFVRHCVFSLYVSCVCVTFPPLPAASCSSSSVELEPPPVGRTGEGEVPGYKRTQCHSVHSTPLPSSTDCTVSSAFPMSAYLTGILPISISLIF